MIFVLELPPSAEPRVWFAFDGADLVTADPVATGTNYLWADDRRVSPQAHTYIGTQAVSRAQNNPF